MSEPRLTNDELEHLIERFSRGRHPKIAAALAELKELRHWPAFHARSVAGLQVIQERQDLGKEAGLIPGDFLANAVPWLVAEIDHLRGQLEGDEMRDRQQVEEDGEGWT